MLTWLLYTLLIGIFVAYPVYDWFSSRRVLSAIENGDPKARLRMYRELIVVEQAATLAVLGFALAAQIPWAQLGLGFEPTRWTWIAWGIVALVAGQLLVERYLVQNNPSVREKMRQKMTRIRLIIPSTRAEWRRFIGVAFTAGICEEILYRGFLVWWLQQHMALLPAAVLSSVAFGLAHAYQGWVGVLQTGLVGGLMMLIVWLAGSLWPAIVLHVLIDLACGYFCFDLIRESKDTGPSPDLQHA